MARRLEDELEPGGEDDGAASERGPGLAWLSLLALGIVYGDIGTSPLYALRECFHGGERIPLSADNVLGVLSLILWSLVVVIAVKYLLYILRADNGGEGGILALMALLHPDEEQEESGHDVHWGRRAFIALGLFGAALLYADGTITPAISVLSAVEGLEVATPALGPFVLPIAVGILVALFVFQRRGTAGVGRVFGPVMTVWFAVLAVLGAWSIAQRPETLAALNPLHALRFLGSNGVDGYLVLAPVFLVVTGGEALYADIGHLGTRPIRVSWFGLVMPALALNYLGQGALLLRDPDAASNPFYRLAPDWATYPLVALATAATVIASQAVISGAFSLTRQAIQLGYWPRLTIRHTSADQLGQVFLPGVNWVLMLFTVGLAVAFGRSSNLAGAYGVAVSTTMVITTLLAGWVAMECWHWSLPLALTVSAGFLIVDVAFLGANLTKLPDGGWFPLLVAALLYVLMSTWKRGVGQMETHFRDSRGPLKELLAELDENPPQRVPGTAVFLSSDPSRAPRAIAHQLEHNHVLHEQVVVLSLRVERRPYVLARERLRIEDLRPDFHRVTARYGFMQTLRGPALLRLCEKYGLSIDPDRTSYFLGRQVAIPTEKIGLPIWRAWLFAFMARNAQRVSTFLHLPHERVIELGVEVEL